MKRISRYCLFVIPLAIVSLFAPVAFTQDYSNDDFLRRQEEVGESAKEISPELYESERELIEIQKQIQSILQAYKEENIDRKKAAELIRPLLKKQIDIMSNEEFQIEKILVEMLSALQIHGR